MTTPLHEVIIEILFIAKSLEGHVFVFFGEGDVIRMGRGGIFWIVVGEIVVVGRDVGGGDWEGNVDTVCLLIEGVEFVVVVMLGCHDSNRNSSKQEAEGGVVIGR